MTQTDLPFNNKPTQAERILDELRKAGDEGVTNIRLNRISFRYGARIFNLRKAGHNIETVRMSESVFRFVLRGTE